MLKIYFSHIFTIYFVSCLKCFFCLFIFIFFALLLFFFIIPPCFISCLFLRRSRYNSSLLRQCFFLFQFRFFSFFCAFFVFFSSPFLPYSPFPIFPFFHFFLFFFFFFFLRFFVVFLLVVISKWGTLERKLRLNNLVRFRQKLKRSCCSDFVFHRQKSVRVRFRKRWN